jgi:putative restriction endonuclease
VVKGIFTTKVDSGYDDDRTSRYHFPKQYLERALQTVGDFAIYYEPRRNGGRSAYIAVVQVDSITPDSSRSGHNYANVSAYLDFDRPVPFRDADGLFERRLRSSGDTGLSGEFRNAIRLLHDDEFAAILTAGFTDSASEPVLKASETAPTNPGFGFAEAGAPYAIERPIVYQLSSRLFRDEAFARNVKRAYGATCAFTGLSMKNGGGRTEVDAAHIRPIGDGHAGPDSVRNGLALSKTVHWMFDRGLLSVDNDYRILTARSLVPEPIKRLLRPDGFASVPEEKCVQPAPAFLDYHRNNIFKEAKT